MQQQTSLRDIDYKSHIQHYIRLFWKWKWYILFAGPLACAIAIFGILKSGLLTYPPLPATVFIGIDSQKEKISEVLGSNVENKERLLLNRTFIEKVVRRLSLQFNVSRHSRFDIFDSLQVDSAAPIGNFQFVIDKADPDLFQVFYTNKDQNANNALLANGSFSTLKHLSIIGMELEFSDTFLKNPFNFSFDIIPERYVIDRIVTKMKVTSPIPSEQKFYFTATLESSDYPLVALTLNTIADMFVDKNLDMQKRKIKETIMGLEQQLAAADQQQSKSKAELRNFLSKNPSVGLSQSTQQTMSELINLETGSNETGSQIDQANSLKEKYYSSSNEDKILVVNEIIVFLQNQGSLAAPSLQASMVQFTREKESALLNYAKSHPIFAEMEGKFASLNIRAIQSLDSYIDQQKKSVTDRNISIKKITSKLQGLPSQELQLAELQKRQDIDSDIYSKLLAKYNEAKVAETVKGADIFIMEYAVQPIAPSRILQFAKSLGIILSVLLIFALGPAIGFDMIDKTVRTEQALTKMLPYRFLETIPLIKMPKVKNKKGTTGEPSLQVREILINDPGIQPPSAIELFRSLSTKIMLDYFEKPDKSLVVTSFEMDEGKSTVAANMAISLADNGIKTVLIDCDLRRGVSHRILSLNKTPGLSDYLLKASQHSDQTLNSIPFQRTSVQNLWAISAGSMNDNPQRLLSLPVLTNLKEQLLKQSFFVVFDSPPIAVAADTAILSNVCSKYLLVVRASKTNIVHLRKLLVKDYPMIEKKILGLVLNMGENTVPARYYSYYYNNPKKRSKVSV